MADLSTHPNWARSSSSRQPMDCITTTSGKPHEFSGPTGDACRATWLCAAAGEPADSADGYRITLPNLVEDPAQALEAVVAEVAFRRISFALMGLFLHPRLRKEPRTADGISTHALCR